MSLTPRRSENTPSGCRERAAFSLAAAAGMDTDNGRLRLEASADSWTARAELLERLELRHDAREASLADAADPARSAHA